MDVVPDSYREYRKKFEGWFPDWSNRLPGCDDEIVSPSGNYKLSSSRYKSPGGGWNVTRGIITDSNGSVVADIKRNYWEFLYEWVQHSNGKEYLICGEDYQGYNIVNLTDGVTHCHIPDAWAAGNGFCWIKTLVSRDCKLLAVSGCFWACPYQLRVYSFEDPDTVPLQVVFDRDEEWAILNWDETSKRIVVGTDKLFRISDGVELYDLPEEEYLAVIGGSDLDDESLWEERIVSRTVDVFTVEEGVV